MRDTNICAECGGASAFDAETCGACGAALYAPPGGLTLWLLDGTTTTLSGRLADRLAQRFGRARRISPSRIAAAPSRRARPWKGHSANAFLNQVARRTRRGELALGITDENIVPGVGWNYLFGLAYVGRHCAVMSVHPLRSDGASSARIVRRAEAIAVHELGHALGLDDQPYSHGPCVMCGDVEQDCVDKLDAGVATFCLSCARHVRRRGGHRSLYR